MRQSRPEYEYQRGRNRWWGLIKMSAYTQNHGPTFLLLDVYNTGTQSGSETTVYPNHQHSILTTIQSLFTKSW